MNDTNGARITSLAQLGQHRDEIETRSTPNNIDPTRTRVDGYQKRPQHQHQNNGQQGQGQFHEPRLQEVQQHERAAHGQEVRSNRPPVDEVAKMIKQRVKRPEGALPYLEDFIMALQEHRFSFTFPNPNELKRFIEAVMKENEFLNIAWDGGDEYMTALMMYKKYAVDDIVRARVQTALDKAAKPKPIKQRIEAAEPASETETAAPSEVVAANETTAMEQNAEQANVA